MSEYIVDGITVIGADSYEEAQEACKGAHAGTQCIEVFRDGDAVYAKDLKYIPFERIRRITGYLVGTVDRFNDAKKAELNDRVKHEVPKGEQR